MRSRCIRARHLAIVPAEQDQSTDSPAILTLKEELAEVRRSLREIVDAAEQHDQFVDPLDLYELAYIPLTLSRDPQNHHLCSTCKKVRAIAILVSDIRPSRPMSLCMCPTPAEVLYCEAFTKKGSTYSRCTNAAEMAHVNGKNLVCEGHREVTQLVTSVA